MEINSIKKEEPQLSPEEDLVIHEMIKAGVLHGRKHSKTNPKMNKFVFGTRRGIDIFDLLQTKQLLEEAVVFLRGLIEKKLTVLVVATKPATKDLAESFAKKFDFPYVTERWLGGTLTNFKIIFKRVEVLKQIREDKQGGVLAKYTKKERLMMDRKLEKLETLFGGIEKMSNLPAALFIIDAAEHETAIREANRVKIPIVALINTDGDPELVQYPIPCNDNARSSVIWVLNKIEKELELALVRTTSNVSKLEKVAESDLAVGELTSDVVSDKPDSTSLSFQGSRESGITPRGDSDSASKK